MYYLDFNHYFKGMKMAANEFKVSNQENLKEYIKDQVINDYIENLRKYNGYTEKGKDITIFGAHYGLQGKFWCDMYVDYVMEESFGKQNARQMIGGFSARTENSKNNYQKIGGWNDSANYTPQKGDQIFFLLPTKDKTRTVNHTGVVTDVDLEKGIVYTIEGNTSAKPGDRSGTTVRKKQYNLNHPSIKGYGTPNWDIEIKDRLDNLEQNENTKENNSPADKLQALIQGLKNDTDGTFATKALAENPDVVANFRAEQTEALKENRQQQETAQNTPQMQEERSYGGRSFG